MTVQLLTLYTDPECHNCTALQMDRQTDDIMMPIGNSTV